MTDKAVLICGIIVSAVAIVGLATSLVICRIQKLKLNARLDEEYGKPEKRGDGA